MDRELAQAILEDTEAGRLMASTIGALRRQECVFCGGKGHLHDNCATKKGLDEVFRVLGLGTTWAAIKSRVVADNRDVASKIKDVINDVQQKAFADLARANFAHAQRKMDIEDDFDALGSIKTQTHAHLNTSPHQPPKTQGQTTRGDGSDKNTSGSSSNPHHPFRNTRADGFGHGEDRSQGN